MIHSGGGNIDRLQELATSSAGFDTTDAKKLTRALAETKFRVIYLEEEIKRLEQGLEDCHRTILRSLNRREGSGSRLTSDQLPCPPAYTTTMLQESHTQEDDGSEDAELNG